MELHSLSKVKPEKADGMDSVKRDKLHNSQRAYDVLAMAQTYWSNMDDFRRERERNKRYTYGDQWDDTITVDGCRMTEGEYIQKQGNVPLKNNLIRRLVRNVIGVYRSQSKEPVCNARDRDEQKLGETMSTVLQYNMQLNRMNELYARTMEEYMVGAFVVHRKWYGWRNDKLDCWTDYVNPNRFFVDTNMRDFRGWDVTCCGEIHDISFGDLLGQFAQTPSDYERLANIYRAANNMRGFVSARASFGVSTHRKDIDFLLNTDESLCRVIEVWRKETKPRYRCHDYNNGDVFKIDVNDKKALVDDVNQQRLEQGLSLGMAKEDIPLVKAEWFVDSYWYYYYLTPFGDILAEGETPYAHKSHPYVFKAYPFIDGEIHSFVSDVIDQQRYANRLVTMYDWIMRASAKGVLLVPDECLGDQSPEDFADAWTRFNGVVLYHAKPGVPAPTQVANNSTNIGISELLNLQLKFFEDISGVHGALQGRQGTTGTSGTLYAQQAQNATTSLLDLLDSFSQFVVDAAYKDVKNIQQFYDQKRTFNIAGRQATQIEYDPEKIRDTEFDLSIVESTATPVYRQIANDYLVQFWQSGQITLQQLLEVGDFTFADQLLQSIKSQQQQMQQGQTPEGVPPELMQQAQNGADMNAVNKLYSAMKGEDNDEAQQYGGPQTPNEQ
nr:MAG TPA: portal protein [Caudoviricetes sp.]